MSKSKKLVVLAGPSGVGKTTISKSLLQDKNLNLRQVIMVTTRSMRKNEVEGKDYYFVDYKTYSYKLRKNELIYKNNFAGNFYGLEKNEIDKCNVENKVPLVIGGYDDADFFCQQFGKEKVLVVRVFPESKKQLEEYLLNRDDGNTNAISERLSKFNDSSNWINSYGYSITNYKNNLDETIKKIKDLIFKKINEKSLKLSLEQESMELE